MFVAYRRPSLARERSLLSARLDGVGLAGRLDLERRDLLASLAEFTLQARNHLGAAARLIQGQLGELTSPDAVVSQSGVAPAGASLGVGLDARRECPPVRARRRPSAASICAIASRRSVTRAP